MLGDDSDEISSIIFPENHDKNHKIYRLLQLLMTLQQRTFQSFAACLRQLKEVLQRIHTKCQALFPSNIEPRSAKINSC